MAAQIERLSMQNSGENIGSLIPDLPEFNFFSARCQCFASDDRQCGVCVHILSWISYRQIRDVIII